MTKNCPRCGQGHPPWPMADVVESWVPLEETEIPLEVFAPHLAVAIRVVPQCRAVFNSRRPDMNANIFMVYLHRWLTPEERERIDDEEMAASGQGVAPYWHEREDGRTRKVFESPCPHRAQQWAAELASRLGCRLESPLAGG